MLPHAHPKELLHSCGQLEGGDVAGPGRANNGITDPTIVTKKIVSKTKIDRR